MALIMSAACRRVDNTLYAKYADIPSQGWEPNEPVNFMPWPSDSAFAGHAMDLMLCVRFRDAEPIGSLPLLITVEDDEETLLADTIRLVTFSKAGEPLGTKSHGVVDREDTLLRGFTLRPGLSVSLSSLAPAERSIGLLNIGLKMSSHESVTPQR